MKQFFTLLFCLSINAALWAQWTELPLPFGPSLEFLIRDTQYIYSAAGNNLFRSLNGNNWQTFQVFPGNQVYISELKLDGDRLWAHCAYLNNKRAYYYSDNKGVTWTEVTWTGVNQTKKFAAAGNTLIRTVGTAVFRSANLGQSWEQVQQTDFELLDLEYANGVFVGVSRSGVWRSTDDGLTWQETTPPYHAGNDSWVSLAIHTTTQGLYVVHADTTGGIYHSADSGLQWDTLPFPIIDQNWYVQSMYADGADLYVCSSDGVLHTQDAGQSWNQLRIIKSVGSLVAQGDNVVCSTFRGVFRSQDGGNNWYSSSKGLPYFSNSFAFGTNLFTNQGKLFFGSDDGLFRTQDEGQEWFYSSEDLGDDDVVTNGDTIMASASWNKIRSFDNGNTWEAFDLPQDLLFNHEPFTFCWGQTFATPLLADSVYHTSDWGESWGSSPVSTELWGIVKIASSGSRLFVAGYDAMVSATSVNLNWENTLTGITGTFPSISGLWSADGKVFVLANDQLYRWEESLHKWKPASVGLYDDNGNLVEPIKIVAKGNVVAMSASTQTGYYQVFISYNGGLAWENISDGLDELYEQSIALTNTTLYATGGAGFNFTSKLWKYALTVGLEETDQQAALTVVPNPADTYSRLTLDNPSETREIAVFNPIGQCIWKSDADGDQLLIPTADWAPGLYLVNLYGTTGIRTGKLLVAHDKK